MGLQRYSDQLAWRRAAIALALVSAMQASTAGAEESAPEAVFSFDGFGTLGIVRSSKENADFTQHGLQAEGAGRTRKWSPDVDSRIGAQARISPTPRVSAVLQVVAEQRHDASYRPIVDWANIKYQATPNLALRAGRIVLPVFMVSDYRKVGYAQPWVRPPVELYGMVPLTHSDGVDLLYRLRTGGLNHTLQLSIGETDARLPEGGKAKVENGWLIADRADYGAVTFHFAFARAKLTLEPYKPLFDAYRAMGRNPQMQAFAPQAAARAQAIADKYDADRRQTTFTGFGISYDPADWFVQAEAGQVSSDSVYGKRAAWYVTAGQRWGRLTPYLSFSRAILRSNSSDPGTGHPAGAPMDARLNAALSSAPVQKTVSAGIRWDFSSNAALKLQFDHARIAPGSPGTLRNRESDAGTGGSFNLFSLTIDFLF